MGRLLCITLGVALLLPVSSLAAPPPPPPPRPPPADLPPPPPPPPPAAAIECFPACRTGFFCYQGQCRSACNPPCAGGEQCLESGQCVPAGSAPIDAPPVPPPPVLDTRPQGPTVSTDGEQAPPGFHYETKRMKGMLVSGTVLFGVGYILSVVYGVLGYTFAGYGSTSTATLSSFVVRNRGIYLVYAVPLVGPALSQVLFATSYGYSNNYSRTFEYLFAGVVSVLQVTGAVLAVFGIPSRQVLVEDRRASVPGFSPMRLSFAPMAAGSALGLTLLLEN